MSLFIGSEFFQNAFKTVHCENQTICLFDKLNQENIIFLKSNNKVYFNWIERITNGKLNCQHSSTRNKKLAFFSQMYESRFHTSYLLWKVRYWKILLINIMSDSKLCSIFYFTDKHCCSNVLKMKSILQINYSSQSQWHRFCENVNLLLSKGKCICLEPM